MTVRLGPSGWVLLIVVNVFLWAPLVVVAMLGFSDANSMTFPPPAYSTRWLSALLSDPVWTQSITTSLMIGFVTVLLSLLLGVPLGLGLARGAIGQHVSIQALVATPLILPAISLAVGFYFVFAMLKVLDSMIPLVVAHTTVGVSYVVITVVSASRSLDPRLEAAARTMGASFGKALVTITLPLISVGIIGGAVLAFLHSWDDVVGALMLGTARVQPFPLKLWGEMQNVLNPISATAAVLLSTVSIAILFMGALVVVTRRRRVPTGQAANVLLRSGASS
ncbi:ABC transporter permease [Rhizobium sp. SYY.PMSO]|uniref:ABC transporter permease n=1 Tax=Rhizobium sp. SYY.PMSO TaxID=3382192 RepID=UPI00398FFCC1